MNLAAITLRLRPRGPYEAMDLGVRLLQRNAGAVYLAWFAIVMPLCLSLLTLTTFATWLPSLLVWWLKPLYDRVVLFVLSRAVFGAPAGLRDIEWRALFGNGLIWALTFRRFDFARSFTLPVYMLEGLKWKRRRKRIAVLQKNTRAQAVLLSVAFIHIEFVLTIGLLLLGILLLPQYTGLPIFSWLTGEEVPYWFHFANTIIYILALTISEPVYAASGFTLYLNRRVELEAWDIEMDLRRNLPEAGVGESAGEPAGVRA